MCFQLCLNADTLAHGIHCKGWAIRYYDLAIFWLCICMYVVGNYQMVHPGHDILS